jgi:hypothetical protein
MELWFHREQEPRFSQIAQQHRVITISALHLLHDDNDEFPFEQWFVVRAAFFKAKMQLQFKI